MINSYKQAQKYLDSFVDYERKSYFPYEESLKLERVSLLLKSLGSPQESLKAVHIAGTKGKGSTAFLCANMLSGLGFKTGLYTSPHFFDFRERVKILTGLKPQASGQAIKKKDVASITQELRQCLEKLKIPKKLGKVTFFEVYTALAFKHFLNEKVDFAVLETGLGGRLDATNTVTPLVCVITRIDYDHTDKLGDSLEKIAWEKSGIIKKRVPLVCAAQSPGPLKVIKEVCRVNSAPFFLLGRDFKADNIRLKSNFTLFDFKFADFKAKNLKIQLKGKFQVENAACALAAAVLLNKQKININLVKKGLLGCDFKGRFEVLSKKPLVVADVAHNPCSFLVLKNSLKDYFPAKKIILIFACSQDKDAKAMLKQINYSKLILTCFNSPRSFTPQELKRLCGLKQAVLADNIKQAFKCAEKEYDRNSLIVVSGSLFVVAEAKRFLSGRQNARL